MAEEMTPEEFREIENSFNERYEEVLSEVNEYLGSPQLTCGQYGEREVRGPVDLGIQVASKARKQEYETFPFFTAFLTKFRQDINEYKELKERVGEASKEALREAYMDEKKLDWNHGARYFNPYWKDV